MLNVNYCLISLSCCLLQALSSFAGIYGFIDFAFVSKKITEN